MDFKGKKIAVLGLGVEGLSSARFLNSKGAQVSVLDEKNRDQLDPDILKQAEKLDIQLQLGTKSLDNLGQFDLVVRSPGFRLDRQELQVVMKQGKLTSQTKLFFDLCPSPIIGVTGTKGKGTTASLIYEMLKKSGLDAYLGGNIGVAPFDFLDKLSPQSRVVLELSSFQLQDMTKSPSIAVLLMVTSEHLDYHKDHAEYVDAKRNLLRFQKADDIAIVNRDYPVSHESDIYTEGKVFQVSRERATSEQGCFVRDDAIWIRMKGTEWKVIDVAKIQLPGKHNLENVCAAVIAATLAGADKESIKAVLQSFSGLEHRLELVREVRGVRYYDDSFSTTPETAIAAIQAFRAPEVLILGGSSKNSDFSELGRVIAEAENIRAIIGIGAEWKRIKASIAQSAKGRAQLLIEGAKDMKTVVQAAAKVAQPGDVVLLSPACASFDMFRNYKERGEEFQREVRKLES